MRAALRVFVVVLLSGRAARAAPPTPWNLQLEKGRRAPTTVSAANRCKATHTFEVGKGADLSWMTFPSSPSVEVAAGVTGAVPVTVDASGLDVGEVNGEITVRCLDCAADLLCGQDIDRFDVRLKVLWPEEDLTRLDPKEFASDRIVLVFEAGAKDAKALGASLGLKAKESFDLPSIGRSVASFAVPPGASIPDLVNRAQKDARVRLAQPDFVYEVTETPYNDPLAHDQWGPHRMGIEAAHRVSTGKGVKVAVLDSGVDSRHPDLKGAVAEMASFVDGGRYERDPHGTSMAGAIAARANNGIGIFGIAPGASILSARVCKPESPHAPEVCFTEGVTRGLDFAIGKGAAVVSMSLGGPYDPLVRRLVDRAVAAKIVVVAAAGNSGRSAPPRYPGALANVIAVSAIDSKDQLYENANRGAYVKVAAPGVGVLTTAPDTRYAPSTGTSIATAEVSGVVALLLSAHPGLTPREVEDILTSTARDLGPPGKDDLFGWGVVDACRALEKATGKPGGCP